MADLQLDFEKGNGLIPVIVQEFETNDILMLAYVNEEALKKTIETGDAHYWSRSRDKIWRKGESSGNVQKVKDIYVDCDADTLVYRIEQIGGAACHKGYVSCFHRKVVNGKLELKDQPVFDPKEVYKE